MSTPATKLKKQKVTFLYRDADNYKFNITRVLESENGYKVDDEVDYNTIGITQDEFHNEIGYPYNEETDHPLLDVLEVEDIAD